MHSIKRFQFLLASCLALLAPLCLRAVDVAPFTVPISFSFRISGVGNGILTVNGEGGSPSIGQTTINAVTESDAQAALLCPGKSYNLNFQASGPSDYWLSLMAPSGYQFYVNGVPKDYIYNNPGGGWYSYDYSIELRPINGPGFLPAGSFTGLDISQAVSWELGLGGARAGHSVGRVGFRELDLSNSPATREHLFYTPPINSTQVNVIRDGSSYQRIRQVVSPRNMVDFVDVSGGYEIRYYNYDDTTSVPATPIYTINSGKTPWHTISVISPGTNQLKITETEETATTASRVSYLELTSGSISSGNYVWTMLEGGPSNAWLRKTVHTSISSGGTRENLVQVYTMSGTTQGTLVSETKYVYHTYAWGEDLYQVIANPNGGSNALSTTYDYYTIAPSSGSDTYRGSYGRVKSVTGPDGSWNASEYYDDWDKRGQLKYQYQPYQDSPSSVTLDPTQGRVKYFEYVADPTGRYRRISLAQEKVNNVTTAKTVSTYDNSSNSGLARIKVDIDSYKDGTYYHRTHTEVIDPLTADIDQSGEPYSVKNPDGTQVSWSRTSGDFNLSTKAFTIPGTNGYYWRILKVKGTSVAGTTNGAEASTQSSYDSQSFAPLYLVPYKSTMDVTVLDYAGVPLRTETRVYTGSGAWSPAFGTVDSTYDFTRTNRLTAQAALNGATTSFTYTNGYLSSMTGGDGAETQFTYDAIGRTLTTKKIGAGASGIHAEQKDVTATYNYDQVDGSNYATSETVSAAGTSETIVSSMAFDRAGRVVKITPPGLSATTISYATASRTQTTTAPDGGTAIQETYRDGRLKSTTGTAVVPQYFTYSVESDGRQVTQVNVGTSSSTRLQKSWVDWVGRPIKLEKPGFSQSSQSSYTEEQLYDNATGQLIKSTGIGMNPTLYVYDALGRMVRSGLDVDNGSASAATAAAVSTALVTASNDRITESDMVFESYSSAWWLKTSSTIYPDANASTHPITSYSRQRLTGFGSGVLDEFQTTDAEGNTVTAVTGISGKLVTTQTTVPGLTTDSFDYFYNGRSSASSGHDGLTTKIEYDPLGRQWKATDARSLVTTMAYYSGTAMPYTTTDSASNVIGTITYDTQGRTATTMDALGKYTRFAYNQRGQLTNQWGDGSYPVSYTYDSTYGDRTGMSTYRGAPASDSSTWPSVGTADTTTWTFDTPSGLMWKKTDASGKYVTTDYNQAGKAATRTLARGVVTTYGYDSATGELLTQTYSDGTPTVTYTYTRMGQTDSVADYTGTWDYVYDSTKPWRQASMTLPSFYGTRYFTALYESGSGAMVGRYLGFQLGSSVGSSADLEQDYAYSSDGRFDTLTSKRSSNSVTRTFDYSYLSNTPFVSGLTITGGPAFSVARAYESNRDLLASIDSKWGSGTNSTVTRYDYTHNALGQRTTAKQSGTAFSDYYVSGTYSAVFNNYTYNARSELETAVMYRGDTPSTTPSSSDELPGRRFEYRFDSIGNRKTDGPTGNTNGVDDHYTANALNQYTQKENNTVRVLGTTSTGTTGVAVVGAPATGKKDRAWGGDFVPGNSTTAIAGTATVYAATVSGGTNTIRTETKPYFIPKGLQTFTYDDDGNLTQDSVWDYSYDAENRLTSMQNRSEVIGSSMITSTNARRLEFKYDYMGRRVRKIVYGGWNGTIYSGTAITDTKYLYDGWNLIAEFTVGSGGSLTLAKAYTWGLDLTGSLTSSGGVGALLQIYDSASSGQTLLPTYDGNGNVAALVDDTSGTLVAAYEYDPSGNLLRCEGSYAVSNSFRFSTKFTDAETGLIYYGCRFYSPVLGRFVNQDPIAEAGGLNLYGFCGNNGINGYDYLGHSWFSKHIIKPIQHFLQQINNLLAKNHIQGGDGTIATVSIPIAPANPNGVTPPSTGPDPFGGAGAGSGTGSGGGTIIVVDAGGFGNTGSGTVVSTDGGSTTTGSTTTSSPPTGGVGGGTIITGGGIGGGTLVTNGTNGTAGTGTVTVSPAVPPVVSGPPYADLANQMANMARGVDSFENLFATVTSFGFAGMAEDAFGVYRNTNSISAALGTLNPGYQILHGGNTLFNGVDYGDGGAQVNVDGWGRAAGGLRLAGGVAGAGGLGSLAARPIANIFAAESRLGTLVRAGENTWESSGGLRYAGLDRNGLNRIEHVLEHTVPNASKPIHSVFIVPRNQVLGLVDEAWGSAARVPIPNNPGAFVTPMGRTVGTAGENAIKIVVRPGTNEVITAFPIKWP